MIYKYFSHIVVCLSTFLMSFDAQKFKGLIYLIFSFLFSFVVHAFDVISKNPLPSSRSCRFTSMFSFEFQSYLQVSGPFSVSFCIGHEGEVQLYSFACEYPAVQHHSLDDALPTEWSLHSCQKSIGHRCLGFISGLSNILHWSMSIFMPVPQF